LSIDEWLEWPSKIRPVEKWGDIKLYECPLTCITPRTWEILRLVNETTNIDGDVQHMPFPGAWLEQPRWYRQAVSIVKRERAEHKRREMEKARPLNGRR